MQIIVINGRRDDAQTQIAHALERRHAGQLILTENSGLGRIDAALVQRFADGGGLGAAGRPDIDGVGIGVLGGLNESAEIHIGDRIQRRPDDGSPASGEALLEGRHSVMAGAKVRHERVDFLDAVLRRPMPQRVIEHGRRDRGARHVGRFRRDDGGGGVHHHHEFLRLGGNVAHRQRIGRQLEAAENVDLVAHDELLGEPLGDVGRNAAIVLADDLDLLARDGVALLLHVEFEAVIELDACIRELAGVGDDQADLDLRLSRRGGEQGRKRNESCQQWTHLSLPVRPMLEADLTCGTPKAVHRSLSGMMIWRPPGVKEPFQGAADRFTAP